MQKKYKTLRIKHIKHIHIIWIVLFSLVFSACSTKKNTWNRRFYHNLTAHYNGWWNGNESIKEGVREAKKKDLDNHNLILPVYNYGEEADGQSMASYADRAIEKGSIAVQRHSMWFKNRERCRWVPKSYLLIGRAYFYKHEFQSARMTFEFITKKYHYDPIQYEAMFWLAKTYIELKRYQKAATYLEMLDTKIGRVKMPKYIERGIDPLYADMYIKEGKAAEAIPFLKRALEEVHKRSFSLRMKYILAQIYQQEGKTQEAIDMYKTVMRKSTEYKMIFNAKMNLAQLYKATGNTDRKALAKSLKRMLKDAKNKNYKDQIYYALSELAIAEPDTALAINYLRLSVATSVENEFQKAVSSLEAAKLYYDDKDFKRSSLYYDTAMQFLPETYPNYESVKRQTATIIELVQNLTIVQEEDSLQYMASLPEDILNAKIDSLIAIAIEAEEAAAEEERLKQEAIAEGRMNPGGMGNPGGFPTPGGGGGGWYFYNQQAKSTGFSSFKATWGNRKLEDNWRLSNKKPTAIAFDEEDEEPLPDSLQAAVDSTQIIPKSNDPKERNYYLQNLPFTAQQKAASNEKISQALFNAGFIYKESLHQFPEATTSFADFVYRNPEEHELSPQVYYQLYLLYESVPDETEMAHYKQLILDKYADSDYAKLLKDPNYLVALQEKHNYTKTLYEKTFKAYQEGKYTTVVHNANKALAPEEPDPLAPKFLYLKAISMAKTDVTDSMTVHLEKLIELYPQDEVTDLAKNILQNMGLYDPDHQLTEEEKAAKELAKEAMSTYANKPEAEHYFVLMLDSEKVNVNATKIRISDYNKKEHSIKGLSVSSLLFNDNTQMITVNKFANANDAMRYYRAITKSTYVFPDGLTEDYKILIISVENYPILYQDKNIDKYLQFFNKIYLQP